MTRRRATAAWAAWAAVGAIVSDGAVAHTIVTTTVLFNREVAKVFNAKCAACHSSGGMAMPLQTFAQSRPWAESIKQEIIAKRMPPWPADRGYGEFANDSGLTPREQQFVLSWIDGGAPEGEGFPPEVMDHSGHWMLGVPDKEFEAVISPQSRVAGSERYTRYVVDLGLTAATAIRAFDLKISDKRVRAAFLSVAETGQNIGGWTPTQSSIEFPEKVSLRAVPGARIAVDVLQPASQENVEIRLGVYFVEDRPLRLEGRTLRASVKEGNRIKIAETVGTDLTIVGFRLDRSKGLRSVELNARTPDGTFKPLLLIREVRPDWPTPFVLQSPMSLPPGSTLHATAYVDPGAESAELTVDLAVVQAVLDRPVEAPATHIHAH